MKKGALVCSNYISRTFNPCSDVTVLYMYLLWYRATGSNLRMVSPSSMSVVKPLMIHACKVRGKILNLATFSSHALQLQTGIYHYFALLPCKEPQNLEKTLTIFCFLRRIMLVEKTLLLLVERFLSWKGNDTGWWGSPGRYESLAILNLSLMGAHLHTYLPCRILLPAI